MTEHLILKWGTIKGGHLKSKACWDAAKRYEEAGPVDAGAMTQRDTDQQKQALCDLIDAVNGEITNDWTGEVMTKEQAKKYVMEWRR